MYLYNTYCDKIKEEVVHDIIRDAVAIEKQFIIDALPCRLIGMNSDMMSEYIEYVADRLLTQMKYNKIFFAKNPFSFMELLSLEGKTSFFEKRNSDYSLADGGDKSSAFSFNASF